MRTVPLSAAKDRLSALVDEVETTHEIIAITRHGRPSAMLLGADDLESLHETLYWLSQPGLGASLAEGEREYDAGQTTNAEDLRSGFGLPPR